MSEFYYRLREWTYCTFDDDGDYVTYRRTVVNVETFKVLRHTPKGAVISVSGEPRFICKNWTKQFACPTVEEAIVSYKARKEKQIAIYEARIRDVKEALTSL